MPFDIFVLLVILLALVFTYTNGFQDGSSVVACSTASGALTIRQAVMLTTIFEIFGALFGGSAVMFTIKSITNYPSDFDLLPILASGLVGAIFWNYITRYLHFPSSSSHALVGGLLGALHANSNSRYIVFGVVGDFIHPTGVWKVILSLLIAPLISFAIAYLLYMLTTLLLLRATWAADKTLRSLQWITVAALAFGHGANDPQKSMGVILLALYASGQIQADFIPWPLRLIVAIAIGLGILSIAPGIIRRVGTGIYKLRTLHCFVAQLSAALVIMTSSLTGGPVSASQVISCSVMGVGSAARLKGVHWVVARNIFLAWFLTIPASGLLSYLFYQLVKICFRSH